MNRLFTLITFLMAALVVQAQKDLNQVIIANGGQFGNPNEQLNLAAFNPTDTSYTVFDTIAVNSVQQLLVNGDYLYVAAQSKLAKYDLDTYEQIALVDFPGISAHNLLINDGKLYATNFYGQTENNLYIFNASDLSVIDTVQEISSPGGGLAVVGDYLYVGQNRKSSLDGCAPFGCFPDSAGYIAQVELATGSFVKNIELENNGTAVGKLAVYNDVVYSLNSASNTITAFNPANETSSSWTVNADIQTAGYRNDLEIVAGKIITKINGGVGAYTIMDSTIEALIDTVVTSFAFDVINDEFYLTATDFFSFTNGYAYTGGGEFQYDIPVGFSPEAIAIHYNNAPNGTSYVVDAADSVFIPLSNIVTDADADELTVAGTQIAPQNGFLSVYNSSTLLYRSADLTANDLFSVEICDNKLNALCTFIEVRVDGVTPIVENVFKSVQIYPNPVSDVLRINNAVEATNYNIFDAQGKAIMRLSNVNQIEVSELPSGIYFLQMEKDNNRQTISFYKN